MKRELLEKYAKLAVRVGANVQPGQPIVITCETTNADFARLCVKEAYAAGASYVYMLWTDEEIRRENLLNGDFEKATEVPDYLVEQYNYYMKSNICRLVILSETPGFMKDVDPKVTQQQLINSGNRLKEFRAYSMNNKAQWSLVGVPSVGWSQTVFSDSEPEEAVRKMWDAILSAVRVNENDDPVVLWEKHNAELLARNKKLTEYDFDYIHFTNSLGTDLKVGLADNHCWCGGQETTINGVVFNPNIPTEENFTMPHRERVNGRVIATKPLNYQGKLIENFEFEFKDGEVVSFKAEKHEEVLKNLLDVDPGSKRLGEVALISHDSPIQNTGLLFYNTLFDENASCHLALGNAYAMNIKGGTGLPVEELRKNGYNESMNHVDFMFGSADMNIIGYTKDNKSVQIFKDGNFVI